VAGVLAFAALAVLLAAVARGMPPRVELGVALVCGASVLLGGALSASAAGHAVSRLESTLGFLAAVFVIAEVAGAAGLFEAAGAQIGRLAHSSRGLVVLVALASAAITAVLSLDATVVLFTPVVVLVVRDRRAAAEPALLTTTEMANGSSLLLPVSNLTNLLVFSATGLSFAGYALRMALPTAAAVLVITFVGTRRASAEPCPPRAAVETVPLDWFARLTASCLAVILIAFLVSSLLGVGPIWIAAGGAVALGAGALVTHRLTVRRAVRAVSPGFLLFVAALSVVVAAADQHGLRAAAEHLVPRGDGLLALLGIMALGALLANLINNLPATLLLLTVIPSGAVSQLLALLVGVNIGPNVTYTGSLATLLWRRAVRQAGVEPPPRAFYTMALVSTPLALVAATGALWVTLRLLGT
jgi:arsenical pump membrane protein